MTLKTLGMGAVKFLKTKKKKASSEAAGWGAHLKRRSRVFKEGQERHKALDLKEIHDKYFDKSGMKKKGKDIVKEGLKGLK
jgi:phage protein D